MHMIRLTDIRAVAVVLPFALTAVLAISAVASAQTPAPAPAPAAPAAPKPAAPKPAPAAAPAAPATTASAPSGDAQPTLLGQYGDWGAYWATPNGRKVCFSIAKPKTAQTNPAGRKRDQAYVFISTRPAENVRNEVSVIIGYPFKEKTDATAEIGADKFAMYTLNDGAWIKNVAEEARMVDAMRKGSDLSVKGVSRLGTESTDTYSLKGLSQAVDRIAQECK
jgi:Invasion associated locus B (IalB) protein